MIIIIRIEDNKIQINLDETIKAEQVNVYCGAMPTLDVADKKLLGTFKRDAIVLDVVDTFPTYYIIEADGVLQIAAERLVQLDGTFNFRDIGGYVGADGRQVKWGKFFRADALCKLTKNDVAKLVEMGIKTVVDYRGQAEWQKEPDVEIPGAKIVNLSPHAEVARLASGNITDDREKIEKLLATAQSPEGAAFFEKNLNSMADQMRELVGGEIAIPQYQKFMQIILDEANTPIIFHCRGGKDRTGWGAMLILFALGVSKEDIAYDYHLTKEYMKSRNVKRMDEYRQYTDNEMVLDFLAALMDTREIYLDAAFDQITKMAGTPETYLTDVLNLTSADIAKLREMYLY